MQIPTKSVPGLSLPVLGLGTWLMGGTTTYDSSSNDATEVAAIRTAIAAGITHIDTAETYAAGHAERLVGQAIVGVDRASLTLVSKVLPRNLRHDDVIRSCKASLERLGTPYLDLYLAHRYNPDIPIAETMRAFAFLYEEGLIRAIGVSNFTVAQLEEAFGVSRYPIVNNQLHFSLSARDHQEQGTLAWCQTHNVLVTAYRPLGIGKPNRGEVALDVLAEVAARYGKTSAQVALNWVLTEPNVVTLVKTSNPQHLDENLGALGWQLTAEDRRKLDREFPHGETIWGPSLTE